MSLKEQCVRIHAVKLPYLTPPLGKSTRQFNYDPIGQNMDTQTGLVSQHKQPLQNQKNREITLLAKTFWKHN